MENALEYFKSLVDQDRCDVVLCNLEHEIIYMKPGCHQRLCKVGRGRSDRAQPACLPQ